MAFGSTDGRIPESDNVALIEAPGPAFREVFGAATPGLAAALDSSTVGVEIYDVNLCSIHKNRAFASMDGWCTDGSAHRQNSAPDLRQQCPADRACAS